MEGNCESSRDGTATVTTISAVAQPVRCTKEVLLPLFTDQCLQDTMMPKPEPPASLAAPPSPLLLLPELRLVLLGRKGAGKSAAGNTILGGGITGGGGFFFESGKPTEECVKRRADVSGRRVTVVDTPGWEWYYPLNSTPGWVRRETWRGAALQCAPGPHAVLLVVRSCASVTEAFTRQIEEHLEPLGRGVWEHAMVLFTRGGEEMASVASVEQRILSSSAGPALQNLLKRCGNRYHILDNSSSSRSPSSMRSKGDATSTTAMQVQGLMRKMEEMVMKGRNGGGGGGGGYFGVDDLVLRELEADGKRRARERRKKQRQMETQTQRGSIRAALISDGSHPVSDLDTRQSFSKPFRRLPEVRLVLLGERETGKSSAGNAILGGAHFFPTGTVTEECARRQAEVALRLVTVVDAPGWEGGVAGPTPERVKREICASVAMCPPGPHALLLALRLDTLVKAGPVTEHLELLGEGVWRHVVLLFTHGDQLREGVGIEQYIQRGGGDLQWLLEKCKGRYHVLSNVEVGVGGGGGGGSVTELLEMVEKMAVGNRCEAFSGLVQEVSGLSRQRNDKFTQRLREAGDKMLRQETEMKKMREREVKSIRWFFDRKKKKVKKTLAGKLSNSSGAIAAVEKEDEEEEEEERRSGEKTKNEMGELEERMRWLTENKEREIQDLNAEHNRILATLRQCTREKDDGLLKLELKEREIEELTERIDEQQIKLLDLERLGSEKDREGKQREGENRVRHQALKDDIKNLAERVELQGKEKAELKKRVEDLQADIRESERHYEDIVLQHESEDLGKERDNRQKMVEVECRLTGEMERRLNEKEKEMEDINVEMKTVCQDKQAEMERKLSEKDNKMKDMKLEMENKFQEMQAEMESRVSEKDKEMQDMKVEMKTVCQEKQAEMERRVAEKGKEMEGKEVEMKTMYKHKLAEIESRLTEKDNEMEETTLDIKTECHERQAEMERKLSEKDIEMEGMKVEMKTMCQEKLAEMERRVSEKDKKMKDMRLEMEKECQEMQAEMERKLTDKHKEMEETTLDIKTECHERQAEMERKLSEKGKEMEEMKMECHEKQAEMESRLSEKDKKMKDMTLEMENKCHEMQAEMESRLSEKDKKMKDMTLEMENKCHEMQAEMEMRLTEKGKEMEGMKTVCNEMQAEMERRQGEKDVAIEGVKCETKRAFEQKVEELTSQHRRELERKIEENEREMEGMKRQHEDDTVRKMKQVEKLNVIQHQEEMQRELRENEAGLEMVNQGHRAEICRIQQEAEREIKEMKQHHADEHEKISQETSQLKQQHAIHMEETSQLKQQNTIQMEETSQLKQQHAIQMEETSQLKQQNAIQMEETSQLKQQNTIQTEETSQLKQQNTIQMEETSQLKQQNAIQMEETSQLKQQHAIQMEETGREHEKEKETILLNYTTEITHKMKEKERDIVELKQQHTLQTEETRQDNEKEKEESILNHEKEMANVIQEREREIVELKRQHASAMERERREKDEKEQVVQVQNEKMEEMLHDKERETIELKRHIENNLGLQGERERLDANHRRELEQRLHEKEQEMKEITLCVVNEKERNVKEREMEMERTRQQTDTRETKRREEQSEREERREEEIEQLKQIIERNAQELIKTQELVTQKDEELQGAAESSADLLKQLEENNEINTCTITEIQRHHAERARERDEIQRHHAERARERDAEVTQKLQEKEAELNSFNRRDGESEKEIARLRQTIEQTKSELKELTGKVEKETTNMIREYEREIASMKQDIESTTREKETAKSRLREVEEDSKKCISDITEKYEESRGRVKELREQNERITQEIEDLRDKHERACEAQRSGRVRREEEITERLCLYEEKVKSKDSEIQNVLRETKLEVTALKRANETLQQREVERMKESTEPKGELHGRENGIVRDTIKNKPNSWEKSLERREAEVCKREQDQERDAMPGDSERCNGDYEVDTSNGDTHKLHGAHRKRELMTAVKTTAGSVRDAHVMYQEVGVVVEEEPDRKEDGARGTEWDDRRAQGPKHAEDQRVETASSASESNKCQSDTRRLGDTVWSTEEERRGRKVETKGSASETCDGEMENKRKKGNQPEEAKVIRCHDLRSTVNRNLPESELRVVMLRENRSSHYPAGVTILGREEASQEEADGSISSSEPWRGQIAGRNVSLVEPLGLGWRNGPDPSDTAAAQRENILESIALSHPGPHVLLLVVPAYLTLTPKYREAVEESVGLFGGEEMWRRTLLLFTWGEALGESTEQHILRNGDLMALVEKCGGRYHTLTGTLDKTLIEGLFEKMEDMVASNSTE